MNAFESLDEQLHSAHARRESAADDLVRALRAIDDASRQIDVLIDRRLDRMHRELGGASVP